MLVRAIDDRLQRLIAQMPILHDTALAEIALAHFELRFDEQHH